MEAAILIATADPYLRAFGNVWWSCFKRYWPDCPWPVLFVTQTASVPGLPVFQTGSDGGWNRRVLAGFNELNRLYAPETVLLIHEDYLVGPQRSPGQFNADIRRCVEILRADARVRSIGLVRKDPETKPYEGWPDMLGYHALGGGILPVDPAGINLWKAGELERHLKEVIKEIPQVRDMGRNGAAEFSQLGAIWAKQREEIHLRVKREKLYPDGVLNILFGVTLYFGAVAITDKAHLELVEQAIGRPLVDVPELKPYVEGQKFDLKN